MLWGVYYCYVALEQEAGWGRKGPLPSSCSKGQRQPFTTPKSAISEQPTMPNYNSVVPYGWNDKQLARNSYGSQEKVKFNVTNEQTGVSFQYSGPDGSKTTDKALKVAYSIAKS